MFDNIDVKTYTKKSTQKKEIGFIAQEIGEATKDTGIEHLIHISEEIECNDGCNANFIPNCQSISYTHMVCLLWQVVKKQQRQIDTLVQEVNDLKPKGRKKRSIGLN